VCLKKQLWNLFELDVRCPIRLSCDSNVEEVHEPRRLFTFGQANTCPVSSLFQEKRLLIVTLWSICDEWLYVTTRHWRIIRLRPNSVAYLVALA
jgi:hypothetical protein